MPSLTFRKYPHLEKFISTEVEGIEKGVCHIFPKLDGSNGSIWFADGEVKCGSRKNDLSVEGTADNQGFREWVKNNEYRLLPFFTDYPNIRLYGEWLVKHTVNYEPESYRKFYVFDVMITHLFSEEFLPYDIYAPMLDEYVIDYIPRITTVENYNGDWQEFLPLANFCMDKGTGEGIVVKRYDFVNKYGRVTWAKVIADTFKETKVKQSLPSDGVEADFVTKWLDEHVVYKERAKLENDGEGKIHGKLLEAVWYDFLTETLPHALHKNSKITLNFALVKGEVFKFVKSVAKDLY